MKKRFLSLLCVLALCLGLLPVTALAADAPNTLWVGETQITGSGYWTTDANGKLTASDENNYNVYYDGSGTLTLKDAKIQGRGQTNQGKPQDDGIYASSTTGQSVSLTINLIGTNTVKGVGGIYITSDGNASLVIQSDSDASKGSLEVSGSGTTGIYIVVSGNSSGNPSLTINNASVEASTEEAGYYGVSIVSYTTSSPTLSLTVNGGSLTAQDGIRYVSVAGTNSSNSLTVSDSALIKAIPNISASGASKPTPQGNGIVFDGNSGTVYGNVTLQEDLEIGTDETLTIGKDASLTVPDGKTLTNKGTVTTEEGGTLSGTITGNQPPKITTTSLSEGTVNTAYNQTLLASGDATITWSSSDLPEWLTLDSDGTISGTPTAAGASTFTVTATNASGSDSKEFTLTISEPAPIYTISADVDPVGAGTVSGGGKYTAGTSVTLTATNNPGYRFVGWVESGTTVSTNPNYTFVANSNRSLTAQFDRISSGGGDSDPTYSITLPSRVTGGELKLSRRYAENGETVTLTAVPDEGYELDTLTVTDSKGKEIDLTHKGGNEYTFKMPAGRVEIEVSFREIEVELPFTDVPEGAWYEDAAAYVYEHGLMAGTSATTFAPDATTSRSMIATILWRMAGSPVVNYAMDYTDVAQGQWYSEAIRWAASEGIVGGDGNGLFGTNDPITREQFAVMLYRFAQEQGYDVSIGENTNILSYTDVADLSEYAISAMQWAVGAGIINGTGDGSTLTPQGQATRAQAAVMLMRFCEEYVTW